MDIAIMARLCPMPLEIRSAQELPGGGLAPDDAAVVGVQEPHELQAVGVGDRHGGRGADQRGWSAGRRRTDSG